MNGKAAPAIDRVLSKTAMGHGGCIIFTGSLNYKGYGTIRISRTKQRAYTHRVMYEHFIGPIPQGLVLDHLCRVRRCCNPYHLEPVTNRENYMRGDRRSATTHCPQGHPYDEANTYVYVNRAGVRARVCRTCRREHAKPIPEEARIRYQNARQELVREAAAVLGITQPELKNTYGTSKAVLRRILDEESRA